MTAGWLERRQIPLYLAAIGAGAVAALLLPGAPAAGVAVAPVLGLLLFATFLGVPFAAVRGAVRDIRFLGAVGVLNFALVPLVAFALSRLVAADDALVLGVLLVLLTPCVDYVVVFAGLAGGSRERLLAATPLLMLAQLLLLPLYLLVFVGPGVVGLVDPAPFVEAFVGLIALPLAAAALLQWAAARLPLLGTVRSAVEAAMVPLLMATLALVVASQLRGVGGSLGALLAVVPVFLAFPVVMVALGIAVARVVGLDVPSARSLVFSGATRNSLVVLPLALALPGSLVPLVVVTQTLVELVAMLVLVRLVPRLVPVRR